MPVFPSCTKERWRFCTRSALPVILLASLCFWGHDARAETDGQLEAALNLIPSSSAQGASRLDEWKALTRPGGASYPATRYAAFLRQMPAWPLQKRIEWRYEHALLLEEDSQTRRTLCPTFPITRGDLLIACAPYLPDLAAQARRLWRELPMTETEKAPFLAAVSRYLTPDDDTARYLLLERTGPYASAQQQAQRLPATLRPLLAARMANHFGKADADALFQSNAGHGDAGLLYYRLKYLRLHNRLDEALQLWPQADRLPASRLPAPEAAQWQDERTALARMLLRRDQPDALQKATLLLQAIPVNAQTADTHLLNGYIALLHQHAPLQALPHFQALIAEKDLNRRAAGLYWMGRCSEMRHSAYATTFFKKAAALPTSFYGQLALARLLHTAFLTTPSRDQRFLTGLQQQLRALPALPPAPALARQDLADAATRLQQEGDLINATLFLTYLQSQLRDDRAAQPAIAQLAFTLHLPKAAILAARQLARDGRTLYPAGYPGLDNIPPSTLPAGLLPALTRQESSMDNFAVSPRHAYGLTQLLLPTAIQIAHRHKLPYSPSSPLALLDPNVSLSIGSLYLADLLTRYNDVVPYALAAYNAGPGRSQQWQADMHSPTAPQMEDEDTLLRWIVLVPYKETRLYIEHIEADMSLYAIGQP